jgi:hypothetical protein
MIKIVPAKRFSCKANIQVDDNLKRLEKILLLC